MNLSPGSHHAGNTIVPHLHSVPVALENAPQATAGQQHSIRSTLTHLSITSGFTTCIFSSRSRLSPPRDMKICVIICYPSKQTSTCQAQLANNSSYFRWKVYNKLPNYAKNLPIIYQLQQFEKLRPTDQTSAWHVPRGFAIPPPMRCRHHLHVAPGKAEGHFQAG